MRNLNTLRALFSFFYCPVFYQLGQVCAEETWSLVTICEISETKRIYRWETFISGMVHPGKGRHRETRQDNRDQLGCLFFSCCCVCWGISPRVCLKLFNMTTKAQTETPTKHKTYHNHMITEQEIWVYGSLQNANCCEVFSDHRKQTFETPQLVWFSTICPYYQWCHSNCSTCNFWSWCFSCVLLVIFMLDFHQKAETLCLKMLYVSWWIKSLPKSHTISFLLAFLWVYISVNKVSLPVTRALVRTRTTIEKYIFHSQRIHKPRQLHSTHTSSYIENSACLLNPPEPLPTISSSPLSPLFCVIWNTKCSVPT